MWKTSLVTLLLAAAVSPGYAQETRPNPPVERKNAIATNPLGVLVGWYNVEYSRRLTAKTALELSAATLQINARVSRLTAGARYYPRAVFAGPFIGVKAGPVHVHEDRYLGSQRSNLLALATEVGFDGLDADYRNLYISSGIGVTRLVGGDPTFTPYPGDRTYFTFRIKIGFAF